MLGTDVVTDALNTIFLAIKDLIKYDRNIDLAFWISYGSLGSSPQGKTALNVMLYIFGIQKIWL